MRHEDFMKKAMKEAHNVDMVNHPPHYKKNGIECIEAIKAAVDSGQIVHWANTGYIVHKDALGQYLITYRHGGSTIGLTDRSGTRLNGAEAEFFVAVANNDQP